MGEEGEGTFTEPGRESSQRLTEEKGKVFYRTASPPSLTSIPTPCSALPAATPAPRRLRLRRLPRSRPGAARGGFPGEKPCRRPSMRRDARRGRGPALLSWLHFARRFCSPPLPARAAPAPAAAPPPPPGPGRSPAPPPGPYLPRGNKSPGASSAERRHGRRVLRPRRCGAGGRGRREEGEGGGQERGGGRGAAGTRRGAGPQPPAGSGSP